MRPRYFWTTATVTMIVSYLLVVAIIYNRVF